MRYTGLNKKPIFIVVGLFVVMVAIIVFMAFQEAKKTATILVEFSPLSAEVTLNGKKGSDTNKVVPGKYTVVIKKDGFESYSEDVTVAKGDSETIYAVLESNSSETADWYDNHEDDYTKAGEISSGQATKAMAEEMEKFQISAILPHAGDKNIYNINYGESKTKENSLAVFITYYTDIGKEAANKYITDAGYNLDDYEIVYTKVRINPQTFEDEPVEE